MFILNELERNREAAEMVVNAFLKAADAREAVRKSIVTGFGWPAGSMLSILSTKILLQAYQEIKLVAIGKAAEPMVFGALEALGLIGPHALEKELVEPENRYQKNRPRVSGLLVTSYGSCRHKAFLQDESIEVIEAGHPLPDENSIYAGKKLVELAELSNKNNVFTIFLISGGASALAELPEPPLNLKDLKTIYNDLLQSGASISQMNMVRKALSQIKAGGLIERYHNATVTLAVSDVPGNDAAVIGSGPTYSYEIIEKKTELQKAAMVLKDFLYDKGYYNKAKTIFEDKIKNLEDATGAENPLQKKGVPVAGGNNRYKIQPDRNFSVNDYYIVLTNETAVEAAIATAEDLGYDVIMLHHAENGSLKDCLHVYQDAIEEFRSHNSRMMMMSGGEINLAVKGNGRGGRNQHFVLEMARFLRNLGRPVRVYSVGSDGIDGPTDAAGATADNFTITDEKMPDYNRMRLDFDSYAFFSKYGGLIKTGPTGTNVMDIRLLVMGL